MSSDVRLARKYIEKAASSKQRGVDFDLSFSEYSRLLKIKKCKYTGVVLTSKRKGKPLRDTDRTLERLDNSLGYVKGNVFAVSNYANKLKSTLENPDNGFSSKHLKKMMKVIDNYV